MALTQKHATSYCQVYGGHLQCRYLDMHTYGVFCCLKQTAKKDDIDDACKKTLANLKKNGQDPVLHGMPLGTGGSCKGYPFLKIIKQGFDVK